MVELMTQESSARLNLTAGETLEFRIDPSLYEQQAVLEGPAVEGGKPPAEVPLRAEPRPDSSGLWFISEPLKQAGLWRLKLRRAAGKAEDVVFAVNLQPGERKLARVPAQAFRAAARSEESLQVARFDDPLLKAPRASQREYWLLLAAALLGVLLVESLLAYIFGNPPGRLNRET
jgi:hypothetical protein